MYSQVCTPSVYSLVSVYYTVLYYSWRCVLPGICVLKCTTFVFPGFCVLYYSKRCVLPGLCVLYCTTLGVYSLVSVYCTVLYFCRRRVLPGLCVHGERGHQLFLHGVRKPPNHWSRHPRLGRGKGMIIEQREGVPCLG